MDFSILIAVAPVLGTVLVAIFGYFKIKRAVDSRTALQVTEQVNKAQNELRDFLTGRLKEAEKHHHDCEEGRIADRKKHALEREEDELRYRKLLKEQTDQFILIDKMRRALLAANIKNI